jgi:ribonuclease BN (tRNA processing enzyme)
LSGIFGIVVRLSLLARNIYKLNKTVIRRIIMRICDKINLTVLAVVISAAAISSPVKADPKPAVDDVEGDLSVMVLGSGGPQIQDSGRASAGYLIFADGKPFAIMDAGSGTFKSLGMSGAHIGQVNTILLSHMHIDHVSELPGIVKGIYFDGQLQHARHTAAIDVYGPEGRDGSAVYPGSPVFPSTTEYMDAMFAKDTGSFNYLRRFVGGVDGGPQIIGQFGYTAHDLSSTWNAGYSPNVIIDTMVDNSELKVTEVAVDHFEAPAVAYRIDYKGHSIVYTGDTHSTSDNVANLAQGADLLIYDTSILDNVPNPISPFAKRHTTPHRLGQMAAAAGAKTLVLSHLTPVSDPNIDSIKDEIKAQGYTGHIRVAKDLKVYNLDD